MYLNIEIFTKKDFYVDIFHIGFNFFVYRTVNIRSTNCSVTGIWNFFFYIFWYTSILYILHFFKFDNLFIVRYCHFASIVGGGRRGRDRMVVGFTTTYMYAISAYHH